MTLQMPDSIYPGNLLPGYPAYLGYVDGNRPTYPELKQMFPAAYLVGLTVTGRTLDADGIDVEPGNPNATEGARWAANKLAADAASRPVMYASLKGSPGYGMPWVLDELAARGILREQVRLHTAHYTERAHICSPGQCGATFTADATQWTSSFPGYGGSLIDMSDVHDSFFVTAPQEETVTVPGMPGEWLTTPYVVRESSGRLVALGQGTSGAAYTLVMEAGTTKWTGPTRV